MLNRDQTLLNMSGSMRLLLACLMGVFSLLRMGAPRCIRASRRSTAKYRDSLMIPEALSSCTCLFLLYPSELGTIGQSVATVCQLRMELQ